MLVVIINGVISLLSRLVAAKYNPEVCNFCSERNGEITIGTVPHLRCHFYC